MLRASNGHTVIALLEAGTAIDLLIADLSMPTMHGAEMVRQIRAMRPDLNVLYVTAHIDTLMRPLWEDEAFLEQPVTVATGAREPIARGESGDGIRPALHPRGLCCSFFKYRPIFSVVAPLPAGRITGLGARHHFHHGLLAREE